MKELLVQSTNEVERLMNENIKVKQNSVSEFRSSHEKWEINKKRETESLNHELASSKVLDRA